MGQRNSQATWACHVMKCAYTLISITSNLDEWYTVNIRTRYIHRTGTHCTVVRDETSFYTQHTHAYTDGVTDDARQ